jgi:DNA-directed RNA polymerase II subunit RPB3
MNGYNDPVSQPAAGVTVPTGPTNQPRILLRKLDNKEVVFHLSGVEMSYANSLRRTMMADVPTIGESGVGLGCKWAWSWDGDRM